MDYVPLIAMLLWLIGVVLMMRSPLARAVPSTELWRLGIVLSTITVVCALVGPIMVGQNLDLGPTGPDLEDLPGRATAVVYDPSGFLEFDDAVEHQGSCQLLAIHFEGRDGRHETKVLIAGHGHIESDKLPIAYDPTVGAGTPDEQVLVVDAPACDRPSRSATTGFAVLLVGGVSLALRRVAAAEERDHRARSAVTPPP